MKTFKSIFCTSFTLDASTSTLKEYDQMRKIREINSIDEYMNSIFIPSIAEEVNTFLTNNSIKLTPYYTVRMLDAHGHFNPARNIYGYQDDNKWHTVESWIKKHEPHNDVLYVNVCNAASENMQGTKLSANSSIIIYPTSTTDIIHLIEQIKNPALNYLNIATPIKKI